MNRESIKEWIIYILIVVAVSFCIVTFVGQRTVVDGHSMNDTLQDQDNLIVDKLSYRFTDIDRFDIVVFRYHGDPKTYFIKRVIGLPGETVQITGDDIYINGELLKEDYGKEPMESPGRASETITLGEDEYFVLGDNRNHSADSRSEKYGMISENRIVGKVIYPSLS